MAGTRGSGISPVQQQYLDVLRSALWGGRLNSLPEDIPGVLEIANRQKTRPMVLDALQKAGYEDSESLTLIYRNTSTHVTLNRNISRLVALMHEAGIDPVLLKGQGVALNYPEPMLRECGDIDLYVGQERYGKACDLLKSLAAESEIANGAEMEKHYHICINGVHIELHRFCDTIENKRENRILQSIADKGLTKDLVPVRINDVPVNTPSDNFNTFFLFFHAWRHFLLEGVGLRQICDWTLFLHSRAGKLDNAFLAEALKNLNLDIPWQIFAVISVKYLGLPQDEMPLYRPGFENKAAGYISLILKDGNFGHASAVHAKRPSGYLPGKWFTVKQILRRPLALYRLFPEIRPQIVTYASGEIKAGLRRTNKELIHQ
ncbi:MAG: nucleotidyltransferase family protein [Bacteroidales bacterium]|nr:nucleotidyltransferase family protein [Bacteroidales bacterium]